MADVTVLQKLPPNKMGYRIIYVFSDDFPNGTVLTAPQDNAIVGRVVVKRSAGAGDIADGVIECLNGNTLNLLRVCAHGNSGRLYLGNGSKGLDASEAHDAFEPLGRHFDRQAGARREIKLHSCYIAGDQHMTCVDGVERMDGVDYKYSACPVKGKFESEDVSDGNGFWFLQGLAEATGATTQGVVNLIHFKGDYDWQFHGPSIYCWPLTSWEKKQGKAPRGRRLEYNAKGEVI